MGLLGVAALLYGLGSILGGYARGRSEDIAARRQAALERERMTENRRLALLAQAQQLAMNRFAALQQQRAIRRRQAHFINGLSGMLFLRPPSWLQPPTATDVRLLAAELGRGMPQLNTQPPGGLSWWEKGLGLLGSAASAYGQYAMLNKLMESPNAPSASTGRTQ